MSEPKTAPYGTWASPITSDVIVGQAVGLAAVAADGQELYWLESRPSEAGRTVLVRRREDGVQEDLTPAPFNVRTRVHEYGGGAYAVRGGRICFSNFSDNRLYLLEQGHVEPLTPEAPLRYADLAFDPLRPRVLAVREDHGGTGEPINAIVAVDLTGGMAGDTTLVEGADFYAAPRVSPNGRQLTWLSWNHPNMPWDGTCLWVAEIMADGQPGPATRVAGGDEVSVFQPAWSPNGVLHFVADDSGWWNLYRRRDGKVEALYPCELEFGRPLWQLGMESYGFLGVEQLVCRYSEVGLVKLARLGNGKLEPIPSPFTWIEALSPLAQATSTKLAVIATAPGISPCIALIDPTDGVIEVIKSSAAVDLDPEEISEGRPISFPTGGSRTAHAFYYPPRNQSYQAPEGKRPPLIVLSHGGPTASCHNGLALTTQFWTNRGFAVVDVNYGGSTGYGRAYRERLNGAWGLVDVEDCISAARFLAAEGLADPDRLTIRGGSAGGYTTLSALTFHDCFKAGASFYGIGDLKALAQDTHKFESRYLDRLIGPLPAAEALYEARSPIHFTEQLDCPVIFLQGLEDKVVPPNQAEAMVQALEAKGLPVAYLTFEGEGHGFRRSDSIKRALEAVLSFYGRVFGFTPADDLPPLRITNLDP